MTNFSSLTHLNDSRCNSSSGSCSPVQTCLGTAVHLVYLTVICVTGVIGNILLLYADYKEWKRTKTPDKVLIFNLAMTNVAGLLFSLPFHAALVANYQDYLECVGFAFQCRLARTYLLNLFNFVTLGTLVVIGIDRYEALTKFAHERTLDVKKSIFASGLVWLCSIAIVAIFIVTRTNQCTKYDLSGLQARKNKTSKPISIAIISIWITLCCTVTGRYLLLAARRIRKHRQAINAMIGPIQAAKQVSFTKGVIGLCLCYIILWTPNGVISAIFTPTERHITVKCSKLWIVSTCHLSFSFLPVIYFIIDRRLRRVILTDIPEPSITHSKPAQLEEN